MGDIVRKTFVWRKAVITGNLTSTLFLLSSKPETPPNQDSIILREYDTELDFRLTVQGMCCDHPYHLCGLAANPTTPVMGNKKPARVSASSHSFLTPPDVTKGQLVNY